MNSSDLILGDNACIWVSGQLMGVWPFIGDLVFLLIYSVTLEERGVGKATGLNVFQRSIPFFCVFFFYVCGRERE